MQQHCQQWLEDYGRQHAISLRLHQGVCALADTQGKELAVIEVPEGSQVVMLHAPIQPLQEQDSALLPTLLALNFEMNAMRGCWLALDQQNTLRLCTQQEIAFLNSDTFAQWLNGFIQQTHDVKAFINEMPAMMTASTASA